MALKSLTNNQINNYHYTYSVKILNSNKMSLAKKSLTNAQRLPQSNLCCLMNCFISQGARSGHDTLKKENSIILGCVHTTIIQ